jgi:murein DD-endopeptidase MepM/ murein hydrolase activator NlpD
MVSPQRAVLLIVLSVLSWGFYSFFEPGEVTGEAPVLSAIHAAPAERVETHVLQRGETLSHLLGRASITGGELSNLLLVLREHRSPRQLQEGLEVTIRRWFSSGEPRQVEVRLNADSTVRLRSVPEAGWSSDVVVTPTVVDTVFARGVIGSGRTLYHAVLEDEELDLPLAERIAMVSELAEVFVFRLDFARDIQPGDRYRLAYEREARPDGTARSRKILIAELENRGRLYPALHFSSGETGGYYDNTGASLRTAFRRYPVDYVRITSAFSWRRYHPVLGVYRGHLGTDFGAPTGTRILAAGDGTVSFVGRRGGYGNVVELRHPGGYTTLYAHMSRFASGMRAGRGVKQGEVIGYVGSTGLATGPHVHYELRKNGQPLDARTAKLPPGAPPISAALRGAFEEVLRDRQALLDRIAPAGLQLAELEASQSASGGVSQ